MYLLYSVRENLTIDFPKATTPQKETSKDCQRETRLARSRFFFWDRRRRNFGGTATKKVLYRDALLVSTNAFLLLVELSFEVCVSRARGFLVFREKKISFDFFFS